MGKRPGRLKAMREAEGGAEEGDAFSDGAEASDMSRRVSHAAASPSDGARDT